MASWREFSEAAPDIAAFGRDLLYRGGEGAAMLATVRNGTAPRIHPINVGIVGDGLYAFLLDSAKRRDLEMDGRFALHAHQDPAVPSEFALRGRARRVEDAVTRDQVAAAWYFGVDQAYRLFEFGVEHALIGRRETPAVWPPRYSAWRAEP